MNSTGNQYKVGQVADAHGIDDVTDELVEYWTRDEDRYSLRRLATLFNQRVLRAAMEDVGANLLDGEVENVYRLLTDDDVTSGVRTETRKRLERDGVNVEALESDFVTHQAVRTYLTKAEDVEHEPADDSERIEKATDNIRKLQNRTVSVVEKKVSQLQSTDRIDLGEFRLLLDLRLICEDCGAQYDVSDLLERGSCECFDG